MIFFSLGEDSRPLNETLEKDYRNFGLKIFSQAVGFFSLSKIRLLKISIEFFVLGNEKISNFLTEQEKRLLICYRVNQGPWASIRSRIAC